MGYTQEEAERQAAQEEREMRRKVMPGDETIAGYWMLHGYSAEEALRIERQQIRDAARQEALYDWMENDDVI